MKKANRPKKTASRLSREKRDKKVMELYNSMYPETPKEDIYYTIAKKMGLCQRTVFSIIKKHTAE